MGVTCWQAGAVAAAIPQGTPTPKPAAPAPQPPAATPPAAAPAPKAAAPTPQPVAAAAAARRPAPSWRPHRPPPSPLRPRRSQWPPAPLRQRPRAPSWLPAPSRKHLPPLSLRQTRASRSPRSAFPRRRPLLLFRLQWLRLFRHPCPRRPRRALRRPPRCLGRRPVLPRRLQVLAAWPRWAEAAPLHRLRWPC